MTSFESYDLDAGDEIGALQRRQGQWELEGSYAVGDSTTVDGAQHSDGAHIVSADLGRAYPLGLLVVHDGENTPDVPDGSGEPRPNTNFKFVPAHRLIEALDLDI